MAGDYSTRPWNHRPVFNTDAGVATLLIVGGLATEALLISNEDTTNSIRIRFDGEDATATVGILLAPSRNLYFANGEVPTGNVSAWSAFAVAVSVAYIQ